MPRKPYAHDAVLVMDPGGDDRAPGGAITVALCGSWEHEPPCPLSPHHTRVDRTGDGVRLRVLFVAEAEDESRVRAAIDEALARGTGATAHGGMASWQLVSATASEVRPEEQAHAGRLAGG